MRGRNGGKGVEGNGWRGMESVIVEGRLECVGVMLKRVENSSYIPQSFVSFIFISKNIQHLHPQLTQNKTLTYNINLTLSLERIKKSKIRHS